MLLDFKIIILSKSISASEEIELCDKFENLILSSLDDFILGSCFNDQYALSCLQTEIRVETKGLTTNPRQETDIETNEW